MSKVEAPVKNGQEIQKAQPTISERFLADVERQFIAVMGHGKQFTAFEQRLVQHMYLATDQALKAAEERRTKGFPEAKLATAHEDPRAFTWHNVDRTKLALDTVHRVSLGLDALIPGHLWPVPYFNNTKGKYDVDLRVGYIGRDYVVRRFALDEPLSIDYQLVYSTDTFKALPRSSTRDVEGYEFEINEPFNRGDIVGGFGYVTYDDPRKNRLVLVTQRDFERSKDSAQSKDFWTKNDVEMHLKTVYHRVAAKIALDPAKVNAAVLMSVLEDEPSPVDTAFQEVDSVNNDKGPRPIIDVPAKPPAKPTVDSEPLAAEEVSALFREAPPF